jgi:hypothetical protein
VASNTTSGHSPALAITDANRSTSLTIRTVSSTSPASVVLTTTVGALTSPLKNAHRIVTNFVSARAGRIDAKTLSSCKALRKLPELIEV